MILASANVFPEVWQRVFRAVQEGDLATAREWQMRVQKLARIFCRHGGGVAVKAALNIMGVKVGRPRRPLKPTGGALIHETRAEIQLELEKLGKIAVSSSEFRVSSGDLGERFGDLGLSAEVIRAAGLRLGSGSAGAVCQSEPKGRPSRNGKRSGSKRLDPYAGRRIRSCDTPP